MKIYIYSYKNKINGYRYIGKTNNVERRKREHQSSAHNPKTIVDGNDCTWYRAIRKYGLDSFDFEILEVATDKNWAEREQYWIAYYNTYNGQGYNETVGGDDHPHLLALNEEQAQSIRELLIENKMTQEEIASEYNISPTLVSNINQGQKYVDEDLTYPLRTNYKTGLDEYSELITLLRTTKKTFKQIAQELGMAESSVKKINYGKMQFDPNMEYPIRRTNSFNQGVEEIIDLLLHSDMPMTEISKQYGKSINTIHRINKGQTHFNPEYSYPLRK